MKSAQKIISLQEIKKDLILSEEERKNLRFEHNRQSFLDGNTNVLSNNEFIQRLTETLLAPEKQHDVQLGRLFGRLGAVAVISDQSLRERVLALLSQSMVHLLRGNDREMLLLLAPACWKWLEYETEVLSGLEVMHRRVEEVADWLLLNRYWTEAEKIMRSLSRIRSGRLDKCKTIVTLVTRTIDNLASRGVIEALTDGYLREQPERRRGISSLLAALGRPAAVYLLRRIFESHSRGERLNLIELAAGFGPTIVPILTENLNKKPPWAALRNIICIVAAIGDPGLYRIIRPYLDHEDERVQREMISSVVKLGGEESVERLIDGLAVVNDRLKIQVIRLLLLEKSDQEQILAAFIELIGKRKTFSIRSGNELLSALVVALRSFPGRQSVDLLLKIRGEYEVVPGGGRILFLIDEALMVIEPQWRHQRQIVDDLPDAVSFASDPMEQQQAYDRIQRVESKVRSLQQSGDADAAGRLIYDEASTAAQDKDFVVAEMLRDRLLEVNPLALADAIALEEYIEEQKSTAISSHHVEIWQELHARMTGEEFNALYFRMRQENYREGENIVRVGEADSSLYFLNSGYISVNCRVSGQDIFLKRVTPGAVLGWEQFLATSVWTYGLTAISEVQVQVLDLALFQELVDLFPAVGMTLEWYCQKHTRIPELLKMSGKDRRDFPRYALTLTIRNTLLDQFGSKGRRMFRGELVDISQIGLAFAVRISSSQNARLLLGRQISSVITAHGEDLPECRGVIVGVRGHGDPPEVFTVHVKLAEAINEQVFRKILFLVR